MIKTTINTITEKILEYNSYIQDHISNVQKAANILTKQWLEKGLITEDEMNVLKSKVVFHDKSKISNEEFEPYRKEFYPLGDYEKEGNKEVFEKAWKHHYENNDHHPEYWKGEPMSKIAVMEMICDWEAMSYTFGGNSKKYYLDNKEEKQKIIHPDSIKILEEFLDI